MLARRIFPDGRTRAYAWGRSAAREDVAAAAEALIAMSGQFEQRRLARPSYQRGLLDAFAGVDLHAARQAWRELAGARRAHEELTRDAETAQARVEELRALAEDTVGLDPAREDELRAERERLRHVGELADGAPSAAVAALAPEEGAGASDLAAAAERAVAPLERLAPELESAGDALRQAELQLRETASDLRSVSRFAGGRARAARGGRARAGVARRPAPAPPRAHVRGAAGARGGGAPRAGGARRRPRPGARRRGAARRRAGRGRPRARRAAEGARGRRRRAVRRRRWPPSCARSGWATASSRSRSPSATRAGAAGTRSRS